ncbi:MAG: FAD-binding oxidoreductase, partial [Vicinamibacterales bacterium]
MVVATTALVEALQGIVGAEHARLPRSDDMRFVVDGLKPSVEVTPGSYEEVAAVMRYANEGGLAVIPQGHGAVTWVGNVPRRYDIALSVARLNAIVEYEPADLTISCQAGATITELNVPLSGNRQMIPFAANSASCVGRLLALPMRESNLTWGSVRDFTIGLRVVTADGRIVRTGGKVVKNVAGYDLTKLFLGSMGTLGVIVEASFKLAPAPQEEATLNFEFPSVADGCGFVLALPEPGFSLSHVMMTRTMALSERGASPRGLIRFSIRLSGTSAAVARSSKEIGQLARSSGGSKDVAKIPDHQDPLPAWTRAADPLTCD